MSDQNHTEEAIKQHLQKVETIMQAFNADFYESYDLKLNGLTDPAEIEKVLATADEASKEKMKKLKEDLTAAQQELAKNLEAASSKADAAALAALESQIENL